ncbi:MAG TPA: sulfatase-like hydrolase/transferase, partial [Acidobacteriota bacterium]|nr:sulfatase-like hydrolase/transferase [Acidobacteriota bacterium]
MRKGIVVFALLLLAKGIGCNPAEPQEKGLAGTRPNIIIILADDLSYRDLSIWGQQKFTTPHLDELALQGLRFTQSYSGAPECAPSRGTLMTGLHTGHGPIRQNSSTRGQDHLADEDITLAEVLKEAGYVTGFTGKWGIGLPGTPGTPDKQGFDYSYGYYDQRRAHTY